MLKLNLEGKFEELNKNINLNKLKNIFENIKILKEFFKENLLNYLE